VIRRDSTEAELDALEEVGRRLAGFEPSLNAEWLDGAYAALLCGPLVPEGPADVMQRLLDDVFDRSFGDPEDVALALSTLDARWATLRSQLDPELLWQNPDALQLSPFLLLPDEEGGFPLGHDWARGFLAVAEDPQWGWSAASEPAVVEAALGPMRALLLDPEALQTWVAEHYSGQAPSRDQLVDDALYAAQDLRLWWFDNAPRTAPRRVERTPGRNDLCPCGSGKKYKKCHGAN
jgi:uncharacterized protein